MIDSASANFAAIALWIVCECDHSKGMWIACIGIVESWTIKQHCMDHGAWNLSGGGTTGAAECCCDLVAKVWIL